MIVGRDAEPDEIGKEIVNLGLSAKTAKNEVALSGTLARKDRHSNQAKMTNESLKKICLPKDIPFIAYGNINVSTHINYGCFNLTTRGSKTVGNNILNICKEIKFYEFSISNIKWLFLGLYKPPSENNATFLHQIKLVLNNYIKHMKTLVR